MKITSPVFAEGQSIPREYTMYGENRIPPLQISEVPAAARSLALIMDDPDATRGTFTHWLIFNMNPGTAKIETNEVPPGAVQGKNDYGQSSYGGPRPPAGTGAHHYHFRLFALDQKLDLPAGVARPDFESAMKGHIIEQQTLIGTFAAGPA